MSIKCLYAQQNVTLALIIVNMTVLLSLNNLVHEFQTLNIPCKWMSNINRPVSFDADSPADPLN